MKRILFLLALSTLIQCKKQDTIAQDYSAARDSTIRILEEVRNDTQVPGLAVSVLINGDLVFSTGVGYSDLEAKVPVDPSTTLFRIGSVSKSITSLGLAILYEQHKVDFDSSIQTYVPYFPKKKFPISVRQVAGHVAGIRHYRGREMLSEKFYQSVEEGISIFMNDTLLFQPGTDYRYSSYGWNLISAVIEGASEVEFLEFMQRNVFVPLELENTFPDFANREIPNRTKFYTYSGSEGIQEAPYVDNSYKWAGGGFIATSEDLVKFGSSMINPKIISEETVRLLTETQFVNDTTETNYGIGWRIGELESGVKWFGHGGGSVGGITQLVIYPENGIVVGLVSNSSDVNYRGVQHKIAQWFLQSSNN